MQADLPQSEQQIGTAGVSELTPGTGSVHQTCPVPQLTSAQQHADRCSMLAADVIIYTDRRRPPLPAAAILKPGSSQTSAGRRTNLRRAGTDLRRAVTRTICLRRGAPSPTGGHLHTGLSHRPRRRSLRAAVGGGRWVVGGRRRWWVVGLACGGGGRRRGVAVEETDGGSMVEDGDGEEDVVKDVVAVSTLAGAMRLWGRADTKEIWIPVSDSA